MRTSIEVLKARVTDAFNVTTLPRRMGCLNEMLSTEAVTTMQLECFCADIAETISIQCMSLPPIRLFSVFVSFGNTSSVMLTKDSRGNFFFFTIDKYLRADQPMILLPIIAFANVCKSFPALIRTKIRKNTLETTLSFH